jgi:hypothetical protein
MLQKQKYMALGSTNKSIRDMLLRHGLTKCMVKAIGFHAVEMLESMPFRNHTKETAQTKYYKQEYKIACADEEFDLVMQFLRSKDCHTRGLFLKDLDVTMDYAGSFDKEEVMDYLTTHQGFRLQDSHTEGARTILDNDQSVGGNCLTYMETVSGLTTRCKIYNKFVQMLECKGVRDSVGQHWKDWVCQKDTRLAKSRDLAAERGLTRAEVTFYCGDDIPDDSLMTDTLGRITQHVTQSLVYSTPYADTWRAYCDSFLHSLRRDKFRGRLLRKSMPFWSKM